MQQQQQQQRPPPSARAVTIPFADLTDRSKDLSRKIEEGLGRQGLGIVAITAVPGYPELRKRLLRLAPRLANLPEKVKKELEDPNSRYNFGWSHGKQKFESGKFDTSKGSYFANPIFDVPTTDDVLMTRFPSYCLPNIWPTDDLPELETAFKDLGMLVLEVGLMLAQHCDHYIMNQEVGPYVGESLEHTLARSRCHKGRLLYYFPQEFSKQKEDQSVSSWCGWHTDYATLTGLTCALFRRKSVEIPCPNIGAGLHIRSRDNQVVKVTFEDDELAYITGETTEILSRGHLRATPHCVKAPCDEDASFVDRSTFALFVQPNWDEKIKFPSEFPYHRELSIQPNETLAYGEYAHRILNKHYEEMAAPMLIDLNADGTFMTTGLHWEGFTRILWGALSAAGYLIPPLYEGEEYEERGVPRCRIMVTVPPHPEHPEWADLSTQLWCYRSVEAVETAALWVLNKFGDAHPAVIAASPLGLLPTVDPDDPAWLGRLVDLATLLEVAPPLDSVQTLTRCLGALYNLQVVRGAAIADLSRRLTEATDLAQMLVGFVATRDHHLAQSQQVVVGLQGQLVQLQVERGNHLQQILELRDGRLELRARVTDLEAERWAHIQHIDELQGQIDVVEAHAEALAGVVGMIQQIHEPPAEVQPEPQEVPVAPEEVQVESGLDEDSQAAALPLAAPGSPAASDGSVGN